MVEGGGENQASVRAPAVFISYASQDVAAAARICSALRQAGLEVWFDQSELRGGDVWDQRIRREIRDCTLFMPVISANTASRQEGYFRLEWDLADHRTHMMARDRAFIVPVCLDATKEAGTDVPESFHRVQWTRLPDGNTPPAFTARIVALLGAQGAAAPAAESIHSAAQTGQGAPRALTPTETAKSTLRRNRLAMILMATITVILAYVAVDRFWLSKHTPAEKPAAGMAPVPTPATPAIPEKSVAVLPFTDMSEKHDQEYFGDGMAEEILDLLAKIPGLTVIGRTSSFQFKGKNEDLRTIGAKLNAAYVLEGSVRNFGDQVRITAQLIDARTGAHKWSQTYDRQIGDVLKLQDAIAASVVRELQLTVDPGELNSHIAAKNAEAYDLYLRGRHAADRNDKEGFDDALLLFQQALDRDPTFAEAAAELARTYIGQATAGSLTPAADFEQARRAAIHALKLNPRSVTGHVSMAWIHIMYDWDWAGAERELQAAATLAPGNLDVLAGEAALSRTLGRWDDALRQIKAAVAQDPLDADLLSSLSNAQAHTNQREAEAAMRRAMEIRPTSAYGHYNLGLIALERGDSNGALREMQQETIDDGKQQGLALAYFALGRKADANAALATLIKEQAEANPLDIAQVYAFRGESDEAMKWLERAYAHKDPYLYQIKGDDLFMKSLGADPRYKAFLRKMNLPE
jgi:adenylate cyclase